MANLRILRSSFPFWTAYLISMNNEQGTMSNEQRGKRAGGDALYSLIPLEDFKAILSIDDREDKISRYCLVTATCTIEQYCRRRLIKKRHADFHTYTGDHFFTLREYPLRKVLSVNSEQVASNQRYLSNEEPVLPEFYRVVPDFGCDEDLPFSLVLQIPKHYSTNRVMFKVRYVAGYDIGKAPPDLAAACLELAAWNYARYRGRRIGMTGSIRKEGERFEMSMPENVRVLLEPYRRKVI